MPRSFSCGAALALLALPLLLAGAPPEQEPATSERVRAIAEKIEKLRGRPFKAEVGIQTQSAEAFRRYVDSEIERSLPGEKASSLSGALQAFGLLPRGFDLRRGLADLYVSQAGAYYEPVSKKFFILMVRMPREQLDSIIAHELAHALDDQYFDLRAAIEKAEASENDDKVSALQFVLEGGATYLMTRFQLEAAGADLEALGPAQEWVFRQLRTMDRESLLQSADLLKGRLGEGADEVKQALAALRDLPSYLFWSLHAPYLKGQYAIFKVKASGGWAAVDELLRSPPASTEQMLHPEKLRGESREMPVEVALPDLLSALGPGWRLVRANAFGELGTWILLDGRLPKKQASPLGAAAETPAERAAAGWGGDRYAVYGAAGGETLVVWRTAWDSEKDASEFAEALGAAPFAPGGPPLVTYRDGKTVVVLSGKEAALEAARETLGLSAGVPPETSPKAEGKPAPPAPEGGAR